LSIYINGKGSALQELVEPIEGTDAAAWLNQPFEGDVGDGKAGVTFDIGKKIIHPVPGFPDAKLSGEKKPCLEGVV